MFWLLIYIYSFLAGLIVFLLIRFGICIIRIAVSAAWWIVRTVSILLWKVLRWGILLLVARMRTGKAVAE